MNYSFIIDGRLPNLNDIIRVRGNNRYSYGTFKKKWTRYCAMYIIRRGVPMFTNPVSISFDWIEPDYRRDIDNIASGGCKLILDSLVELQKLPNDSRKYVREVKHRFPEKDPSNPRIVVTIEEIQ